MVLGDVIRVDDVNTYVVKIQPSAQKECIGRLVKIERDDGVIVGVIKNITHTIRQELIPYIGPEMQPKYAPFNEDFKNSWYVVHGLGIIRNHVVKYSIDSPPEIGDKLVLLAPDEIREFHTKANKPSIAYFNANREALDKNVLISIAEQIEIHYPECCAMLRLVKKYIEKSK